MVKRLVQLISSVMLVAMPLAPIGAASGGGGASFWHVGYYNASNRALSNAQALPGGVASLNFTDQANTALLYTDNKGQNGTLLGNLSGKTVTATGTLAGLTGPVQYYGEPDACGGTTAYVRYFFETSNAGGFDETHYWWSNPVAAALTANGPVTLAPVSLSGANWSDFYGHNGTGDYAAGFNAAVSNVTLMGLSFGGGCFFENGVGTTDGHGTFTIDSFNVN